MDGGGGRGAEESGGSVRAGGESGTCDRGCGEGVQRGRAADDGRWPCHQGLDEGLGSWFHLRNALRSGQSRVA